MQHNHTITIETHHKNVKITTHFGKNYIFSSDPTRKGNFSREFIFDGHRLMLTLDFRMSTNALMLIHDKTGSGAKI